MVTVTAMNSTNENNVSPTIPALSRRNFVVGLAGTAATIAAHATLLPGSASAQTASSASSGSAPTSGSDSPLISLQLNEIQGNVIGGFNKDNESLVFFRFLDAASGRGWLSAIAPSITTAAQVSDYKVRLKNGSAGPVTWLNIAFSSAGLRALGLTGFDLQQFPGDFREGMAARAAIVGDQGPNASSNWPAPYRGDHHAVVIIGADQKRDMDAAVMAQRELASRLGVELVYVQAGAVRADEPGHEHFGFRDGISQPGVRGYTAQENPANPDQGVPGQDLLWPGEFVLGYPRQAGVGGGKSAGPIATAGPSWTVNGSFLVFRRLAQDVAGFRTFMREAAKAQGISEDLMGAKIVGRYKSGAPLEVTGNLASDPGFAKPELVADTSINNFEYGDDPDGKVVPLASHIRKTYPRDEPTRDGGEEDTQTHRIMRRGIPYGGSLSGTASPAEAGAAFPNDRGLLFLCYQTSIARQFEFIQRRWVNDPDFPRPGAGHDPVMSQVDGQRSFNLPTSRAGHIQLMQRFVTTTGGGYFFQPSISALAMLAAPAVRPTTSTPRSTSPATTGGPASTVPPTSRPNPLGPPPPPTTTPGSLAFTGDRPRVTRPPATLPAPPRRQPPRR